MRRIFCFLIISPLGLSYSCKTDNPSPAPEENIVKAPSSIQLTVADGQATFRGNADVGSEVTFQYAGKNGQVLRTIKPDKSGSFDFSIDRLVGYEQRLIAFATRSDQRSAEVTLAGIPAKAAYDGGWDNARQLMQAQRWKSDQTVSRTIIKQSSATPPYDMFATVAQKYFDFKSGGVFHFEVTSPLQFIHTSGTWTMDAHGVITIGTAIPLGPMQIGNAKIQHLDADRLTILANISDGLFLLSMTK